MSYQPLYKLTDAILSLVAQISEVMGRFSEWSLDEMALRLRRINRIRTVTGSLAIEGNTLSETQISAILEGKQVVAPAREIAEARNALDSYAQIENMNPLEEGDLLAAHQMMMAGLIETVGSYRSGGVGVMSGETVIHMAPPASQVPRLMSDLFAWIKKTDIHPLLSSSIFHYEFEFIHPFADGNGRLGRLWQTLLLYRWRPLMADLPVESMVYRYQSA
ncbi:MAG: Fic family protein, partial [Gammaproteobacteria bacterium]|nr:Fic family protein [Gammaproteobacteria bacterium]